LPRTLVKKIVPLGINAIPEGKIALAAIRKNRSQFIVNSTIRSDGQSLPKITFFRKNSSKKWTVANLEQWEQNMSNTQNGSTYQLPYR
jgi:hypothetical protein